MHEFDTLTIRGKLLLNESGVVKFWSVDVIWATGYAMDEFYLQWKRCVCIFFRNISCCGNICLTKSVDSIT